MQFLMSDANVGLVSSVCPAEELGVSDAELRVLVENLRSEDVGRRAEAMILI